MVQDRSTRGEAGRDAQPRDARVMVVQHQDDCPPALFSGWLASAGLVLDVRRPYRGDPLPATLDDHAGLIVLGGSMGAHDDAVAPWLVDTRHLLRHGVEAGRPVLGLCLGHQLAVAALGGTCSPNPRGQTVGVRDIGWLPSAGQDPLFDELTDGRGPGSVAHWNTDVVTGLPSSVRVLAQTDDGAPQVVRLGERAWGVQFHPEIDHSVVAAWAEDERAHGSTLDLDSALKEIADGQVEVSATGHRIATWFARLVRDTR